MEFLSSIDTAIFSFINGTMANPVSDMVMPYLTDLNKYWWGLTLFVAAWLLLFARGGHRGRVAAILLLICIAVTDQLNSGVLKDIFHRPRPCATVDGVAVMEHVHLLVNCGRGDSFPSSHAANNFGAAFLLAFFYRSWAGGLFLFAGAVGLSRISVGVHYPSDILGGAIVGWFCSMVLIFLWRLLVAHLPGLEVDRVRFREDAKTLGS